MDPAQVRASLSEAESRIPGLREKAAAAPDDVQVLDELARLLCDTARYAEAAECYARASRMEPRFRRDAARSWLQAGRFDAAYEPALQAAMQDPADVLARWYLHLALTRTGRDPLDLPDRALRFGKPPGAAAPEGLAFRDGAEAAGVASLDRARGVAMEDLDGDGDYDLVAASNFFPLRLYRNVTEAGGPLRFEDATADWGLGDQAGAPWGAHLVDYDGDGDLDLYAAGERLYRRDGGRFHDVTREAGLPEGPAQGWLGVWLDAENDGDLDFFSPNHVWTGQVGACRFLRNNGDGTFTDVASEAGLALRTSIYGAAASDYDKDGDTDLFLNGFGEPGHLYRNDGDWRFRDVTREAGAVLPEVGYFCAFADFDHDAWPDLWASGNPEEPFPRLLERWDGGGARDDASGRLLINEGDGTFRDATAEAGLLANHGTMGGGLADLDGDGWIDVFLGNGGPSRDWLEPNALYRSLGPGEGGTPRFAEIAEALGLAAIGGGHGSAFGDLDRDGDLDLYQGIGSVHDAYRNALYLNESSARRHFLTVHLRARGKNTRAIGAKLLVEAGGMRIYREVTGPAAFGSTSTYAVELGLGAAGKVDSLEIRWPRGETRRWTDVSIDREITVLEGEDWREGRP